MSSKEALLCQQHGHCTSRSQTPTVSPKIRISSPRRATTIYMFTLTPERSIRARNSKTTPRCRVVARVEDSESMASKNRTGEEWV